MKKQELQTKLSEYFDDKISKIYIQNNELNLIVDEKNYYDCILSLRNEFNFEQLIDLCGIDYLLYGTTHELLDDELPTSHNIKNDNDTNHRFAVITHLLSYKNNLRLRVKVYLSDDTKPAIKSICDIYSVANWFEREAFDLLGIDFTSHPDMRRILSDYGFEGHPLRKDFPTGGRVEIIYDNDSKKVKYQTTTHEPRVLVPRVIKNIQNSL
ncbi:MAG: NADH-quinone oxidoreductase subunit C [Gammaproteobacteria bacterium]|nr:MAG: NADH-quinone oxidoreductase subunit C [Gammaproteobacteria bacterium]